MCNLVSETVSSLVNRPISADCFVRQEAYVTQRSERCKELAAIVVGFPDEMATHGPRPPRGEHPQLPTDGRDALTRNHYSSHNVVTTPPTLVDIDVPTHGCQPSHIV